MTPFSQTILKRVIVYSLGLIWIVFLLLLFAVPKMAQTYEEMDMELPTLHQWIINLSNLCIYYAWFFFPLLVLATAGLIVFMVVIQKRTNRETRHP